MWLCAFACMGEDRNELDSSFVLWANRYMGIQGGKRESRMFPDFLILLLEVVIKKIENILLVIFRKTIKLVNG